MATTINIKPLDGAAGYLRWKESILLRIRTLGVAYVLFDAHPTVNADLPNTVPGEAGAIDAAAQAAAKKWTRDDAVCRGHILATLSDRLLPDYARFATAADLWRALARTNSVDAPRAWRDAFDAFAFERGAGGDALLEQIAHAEDFVAYELCGKLPEVVSNGVVLRSGPHNEMSMGLVWDVARRVVSAGPGPEHLWRTMTDE